MEYTKEQIEEYKEELRELVKNQPCNFSKTMVTTRKYLMDFVNWMTPLLDTVDCKISTRCYWVLHNITDFPSCCVCGERLNVNVKMGKGYPRTCRKCNNSVDSPRTKHTKEICLRKYGCRSNLGNAENKRKSKETLMKHYGVDHNWKSKEVREHGKDTCEKLYGDRNYNNRDKCRETFIRHAKEDPNFLSKVTEKTKRTCMERYGVDHDWKSKEVREHCKDTCEKLYGDRNYNNREKFLQTCLRKYGRNRGNSYRYFYDDHYFDSSYELVYYIWLKDHNVEFTYPCPILYDYYDLKGKHRTYHPDFMVEGKIVEIKGLQFFEDHDPNKRMICPYNRKNKVDDDSKGRCMKEHNVIVLTNGDIKPYTQYVIDTYGKDFIQNHKVLKQTVVNTSAINAKE